MAVDKAWRRRGLAVALSIGAHVAFGLAFVALRPAPAVEPPPIEVELVPWRVDEPDRTEQPREKSKTSAAVATVTPAQPQEGTRSALIAPLPQGIVPSPIPAAPSNPAAAPLPAAPDFAAMAQAVIPGWPLGCDDPALLTRAMRQRCADAGKGRGERQTFARADGSLRPQPGSRLSAEKEARYNAEAERKQRCIAYREGGMPPGLPTQGRDAPDMGYVPSLTKDRCWSMH